MGKAKVLCSMIALALLASGCGKKSNSNSQEVAPIAPSAPALFPGAPNPLMPPGSGTSALDGAIDFTPVSLQVMSQYVGNLHPLNNPTNIKLGVNLHDVGSGRYAGTITISYVDNGQNYVGTFVAPDGVNSNYESYDTARDVGVLKATYNYWFNYGSQVVFNGFFQDNYGGIVLVIDNVVNQGDGQGGGYVSGSVWYRNFINNFSSMNQRNCWFIYAGPYDCRSNNVISKSSPYPSDTYTKLGSFNGLVRAKAFQ